MSGNKKRAPSAVLSEIQHQLGIVSPSQTATKNRKKKVLSRKEVYLNPNIDISSELLQ